mmetsp:Transcript_7214/g.20314  ORF Transcript_7214/g.20314 Transcript_7214/m.20314 type:complete len:217 (-) Transcript_7214:73-723(-)
MLPQAPPPTGPAPWDLGCEPSPYGHSGLWPFAGHAPAPHSQAEAPHLIHPSLWGRSAKWQVRVRQQEWKRQQECQRRSLQHQRPRCWQQCLAHLESAASHRAHMLHPRCHYRTPQGEKTGQPSACYHLLHPRALIQLGQLDGQRRPPHCRQSQPRLYWCHHLPPGRHLLSCPAGARSQRQKHPCYPASCHHLPWPPSAPRLQIEGHLPPHLRLWLM